MKPFLKWVGGKRKLIPQYEALGLIPKDFNLYFEPFLGGGAMFFYLASRGQLQRALLSDSNEDLVLTYEQVKNNLDAVGEHLKIFAETFKLDGREVVYNATRKEDVSLYKKHVRAARFIYLNKACRSGIWRVNQKGEFNTPIGEHNQTIYQPELLESASEALKAVPCSIIEANGLEILPVASEGDFCFIDPPYHGTYGGYTPNKFEEEDQIKLRDICKDLVKRKVKILVCNSDTDLIQGLYNCPEFKIYKVERSGAINSDLGKRQKVKELAITGV